MNDPRNNLEEVFRTAHAQRGAAGLPPAFSQDVMRSVRNLQPADDDAIFLLGAAWTGAIAAFATAVVFFGGFLDVTLGSEWFGDPLGLASLSFFGS